MTVLRKTLATRAIVDTILRVDFPQEFHAYGLCRELNFHTGVVVPILQRLERHGHLTSWTETEQAARELARRPRRYYRLTDEGAQYLERWRETNGKVPL